MLVLIMVGSAWIFGCESTPIVTKHEILKPPPRVEKAKKPLPTTTAVADEKPVMEEEAVLPPEKALFTEDELYSFCVEQFKKLPGTKAKAEELNNICKKVNTNPDCYSTKGLPIFHYNRDAKNPKKAKRILTISLIHGDEPASGSVSRSWMSRLDSLDPRNTWRVIPVANPDGFKKKTRMNVNGVDLNRNFPTKNWEKTAIKHWKVKKKADPRKFPGKKAASEPETQCLVKHIEEFKPDFIISIHTPYGVLDFDGPPMKFPSFKPLPWISLGNYPGSLGRYMWVNNQVPVLTIELKGERGINQLESFDRLQDISGTVAIQSTRIIKNQRQKKTAERRKKRKPAN